jgi:hypothetical protein
MTLKEPDQVTVTPARRPPGSWQNDLNSEGGPT